MRVRATLLFATVLFFQNPISAEAGMGDKVIGSTIKTVVKAYVAVTNVEKAKKKITHKLREADEDKYRARYARLYELIKDLPQELKAKYKVTPHMSKEQLIKNVQSVDKKTIYKTINSIPDKTIAALFKQYLKEMGQKSHNNYTGDSEP